MNRNPRQALRRAFLSVTGGMLLLLTGCGDDKPYSGPDPSSQNNTPAAPAPGVLTAITPLTDTAPTAPDPLLSGSGAIGTDSAIPTDDPLLHKDPLAHSDPLQGHAMPTEHSHWLRGRIRDARVSVLLNGIRQGVYTGIVDQDITMRLRSGVNTVTFQYAPGQTDASAQMEVYESEHDPPIPALVAYQSAPQPSAAASLPTTTQSFTFFAK